MSIKVVALTDLAQTLGDNVLTRLVKGYSPSGELRVGLTPEPENETVRNSTYTPDDKTLPKLYISTRGMEILGITTIYPGLPDHMKVLKYESSRALPFINAFNKAKNRAIAKQAPVQAPAQPVQPLQAPAKPVQAPTKPVQAPTKPVAPPAQQAPTQSIPKNYRRIDSSKRKLYHVVGQFYPPYTSVIVAIGDSPQNSEVYTEDGQKLYLGVKRYKLLKQGTRAGLQVTPINPNNGGSKMALAYYKIALV